nr:Threo-3-hydroxyaspartate ammonia-lyase [Aeromicrobium sp.]
MTAADRVVGIDDVRVAAGRLSGVAIRTPVMRSDLLDELCGCRVHLKAEMFQRTGSFKFRGAYNAVVSLTPEQQAAGVVTYSSGNHGQALACAATLLGVAATVVMPADAPTMKVDAVRRLGAEVVTYDRTSADRAGIAQQIVAERGGTLIPPYDHDDVIAGQGTVALELLEQVPGLDALMVPVGGGGLIAGCATAAKALAPGIEVIGVEPAAMPRLARSLDAGRPVGVPFVPTVADALQTVAPGERTFTINARLVDTMVGVADVAMVDAVVILSDLVKVACEPSGAAALAGLLTSGAPLQGLDVGVVLSGANLGLVDFVARRQQLLDATAARSSSMGRT